MNVSGKAHLVRDIQDKIKELEKRNESMWGALDRLMKIIKHTHPDACPCRECQFIRDLEGLPKRCSFCDLAQATPDRIPACQRPATLQIRGKNVFGGPAIYDACEEHSKGSIESERPLENLQPLVDVKDAGAHAKELRPYVEIKPAVWILCRGCGARLVNAEKDAGEALENLSWFLDPMVIADHLNLCPWRRTT